MKLQSKAFKNGEPLPTKYTCEDDDISPPLIIEGVPKNARSLALIFDDHDVPLEISETGTWDHWIVFNIPPETTRVQEGKNPKGTIGINSWGKLQYNGPCPPDKQHTYTFKLYALDGILDLPKGTTKLEILRTMEGHVLANATLTCTYIKRNNNT